MGEILKWLSEHPNAAIPIIASLVILVISATSIYLIAFFQGREISFWPPKIGSKPVVEKLPEKKLIPTDQNKSLSSLTYLRSRSELKPLDEQTKTAVEIVIVAVSAISLIGPYFGLFDRKLKEGCKLRVVLLDPESPAVETWNIIAKNEPTEPEIYATLKQLRALTKSEMFKGQCEIRLSKVFPPYSMFIIDPNRDTCSMIVEFHAFKTPLTDRPHIRLNPFEDLMWFNFYMGQFDKIWGEAENWHP